MNIEQMQVRYKMPVLIMTVGLPRSGKSTWAMRQGVPVVNPDSIRAALGVYPFNASTEMMVWTIAHYMVDALVEAGHPVVILDATNTTKRRRREWLSKRYTCVYKMFEASDSTCIARAKENGKPYLEEVIVRMQKQFEPVERGEGDLL